MAPSYEEERQRTSFMPVLTPTTFGLLKIIKPLAFKKSTKQIAN
jgi:hypothetical protein